MIKVQHKTDKQAVATAFGKAVDSYDHYAAFQRDVGQKLLAMLPSGELGRVLDLGCGTGHFSASLISNRPNLDSQRVHGVVALDLAPEMARRAGQRNKNILALVGDADHLPLQSNSLDHAFSSLVLQWCDELSKPLAELKRVIKGSVVFSTLLEGSLTELAQSWMQVDGKPHINRFSSQAQIESSLLQAGISNYRLEVKTHRLYFQNAKAVMAELKGIGANHVHEREANKAIKGLGGGNKLKAMYRFYEKLRTEQGLPVSYQVCYVCFNDEESKR